MTEYIKGLQTGENSKGLGKKDLKTRQYVGEIIISQSEALKKKIEKENVYKEQFGSGKYIEEGILARITEEYLVNPEELSKLDLISFMHGYIESSNELLRSTCFNLENCADKKVPDKLKNILKKKSKIYKDLKIASAELLYNVGLQDVNNELIDEELLPDKVKENKFYQQGREDGLRIYRGR